MLRFHLSFCTIPWYLDKAQCETFSTMNFNVSVSDRDLSSGKGASEATKEKSDYKERKAKWDAEGLK